MRCVFFKAFSKDCFSDYGLNEILVACGFESYTYVLERYAEVKKEKKWDQITKSLEAGWCWIPGPYLKTQEIEKKAQNFQYLIIISIKIIYSPEHTKQRKSHTHPLLKLHACILEWCVFLNLNCFLCTFECSFK